MKLNTIREYGTLVVVSIIVIAVMYVLFKPGENTQTTKECCTPVVATVQPFPIRVNPFILQTNGPYHVGQTISMKNGICNITNADVAVTITLGVREEGDPLRARNVVVIPSSDRQNSMIPIAPGCIPNSDVLTGPLPSDVGVGTWRVYLILVVRGFDKPITMQSDPFEVIQ